MTDGVLEDLTVEERLRVAAREEVRRHGLRRANATAVSARAGVSRMTLHRRAGGMKRLLLDAVTTEFEGCLDEAERRARSGSDGRDRLRLFVLAGLEELRSSELVSSLRRNDPDLLLPYLVGRWGASQRALMARTERMLAEGVADGSIRDLDPHLVASTLLVATQGFVVSAEIVDGEASWPVIAAEVDQLVDGYLGPRTAPPSTPTQMTSGPTARQLNRGGHAS